MIARLAAGEYYGSSSELLREGGLLLEHTRFESSLIIPKHEHEHAFFCLVTAGRATRQWPGQTGQEAPMVLTMFPAEQPHQNEWGAEGGLAVHIEFSKSWVERSGSSTRILTRAADYDQALPLAIARRVAHEFVQPDDATPLAVEGLVLQLISACIRQETRAGTTLSFWLNRVEQRLSDDWRSPPSMRELAAEVNVSPDYLTRCFRAAYGTSPANFVRKRRLEEAVHLMLNESYSLLDIALACGFADQSHFCRLFKRMHGVSPQRYRAALLVGRKCSKN